MEINEESRSESSGMEHCSGSSSASLFSRAMLSQRIVNIEYYMAPPVREFDNIYSDFRNSSVKRVPVIRVFGATSAGQKMCTNIHGVYPYISVLDDETVEGFDYRIASALDEAINDSVNSIKKYANGRNQTQHVFKVMRVIGRTFYGYKPSGEVFLRIFFYNPLILRKAVDLLQSGAILGRRFQPYEAHIPYSLQFMIDYSLYGMNFIHYSAAKFRRSAKAGFGRSGGSSSQNSNHSSSSTSSFINPDEIDESLLGPPQLAKLTLCELEVDVVASDILIDTNRTGKAVSLNPGIDAIWKDEMERRRMHGVENSSQITIPESQERDKDKAELVHSAEDKFRQILWTKLNSLDVDLQNINTDNNSMELSFIDETDVLPSSQVPDHLSGESNNATEHNHQLSPEEDELIKLLENMAAEAETKQIEHEQEHPIENLNEQDNVSGPEIDIDDAVWDDSLLSQSILEEMLLMDDPQESVKQGSDEPVILQCDGQTNDSDSSSDGSPKKKRTRLSVATAHRTTRASSSKPKDIVARSESHVSTDNQRKKSDHQPVKTPTRKRKSLSLSKHRRKSQPNTPSSQSQNSPVVSTTRASRKSVTVTTGLKTERTVDLSTPATPQRVGSDKTKTDVQEQSPRTPSIKIEPKFSSTNSGTSAPAPLTSRVGRSYKKPGKYQNFEVADTCRNLQLTPSQREVMLRTPIIALENIDVKASTSMSSSLACRNIFKQSTTIQQVGIGAARNDGQAESNTNEITCVAVTTSATKKRIGMRKNDTQSKVTKPTATSEPTAAVAETGDLGAADISTNSEDPHKSLPVKIEVSTTASPVVSNSRKRKRLGIPKLRRSALLSPPANRLSVKESQISELNTEETPTVEENSREEISQISTGTGIKTFTNAAVSVKPTVLSIEAQTTLPNVSETSVQATPDTNNEGSQTLTSKRNIETQTRIETKSIETQTDAVAPLCHCQCTCVWKEKADVELDVQTDLKPVMESKKIQVDNVDIITRARSARFTTPTHNRIRNTTPFRSPEKRRSLTESPKRRNITTPTSSRFITALLQKTPTSHRKIRKSRSPLSPCLSQGGNDDTISPSSRATKEAFLIHSIRSSASPKKRVIFPRARILSEEPTRYDDAACFNGNVEPEENCKTTVLSEPPADCSSNFRSFLMGEDQMEDVQESMSPIEDLSVNSIYEYEDSPSTSSLTPTPKPSPGPTPSYLSVFQRKRILSKNRSKVRLEKRKAANLEANRTIPDVFSIEYEPLKHPSSYKSTKKWLATESHRPTCNTNVIKSEERPELDVKGSDESSDEEAPPLVKLFGGGNMSDNEDEDSNVCSGMTAERVELKPFTPSSNMPAFAGESQSTIGETPRSILRQCGNSKRQKLTTIQKRKIRWEDETPWETVRSGSTADFVGECDGVENGASFSTNEPSLNKTADFSELDGPTFKNALGLENSMANLHDVKALQQWQFLTTMSVEVHCRSRKGLTPDPSFDPILAIFVFISSDYPDSFRKPKEFMTVLLLEGQPSDVITETQSINFYNNEIALIDGFLELVREWDPDIFVGYEVEKFSFGYVIQRGYHIGKDMTQELSRVLPQEPKNGAKEFSRRSEEWNGTISGRIVLNLWRLLRHEISVQSYTFENAAYHILRRRVCKFTFAKLSDCWLRTENRFIVMQYYITRVRGVIQMMDTLDLINRTSELARVFGIQFYEVLSRGSQFRVESMMLRATKPLDLIAPSPTVMQRAKMRAPEFLPLIMEPRSKYYTDPVAVLDFQSLYPSMMIAYNYDYASLLGRVEHLGSMDRFSLGCLDQQVSPSDLLRLKSNIHISPAGVAFLEKSVVKGVLPDMLEQILDTRQMVKRAMKRWKNEGTSLQKVLDSRQLALKLIANVTYGYTSANFSGRMPCVEIADSIVSKGRETLQRAVDYVKANQQRWGAEVVYGDTDSLFILFRGKSRDEAFKSAYEIADEITQTNPKPVKLKFEKVYQPCILQTKKRYVGYAYETPDQIKPIYDAKGIETVRRDGCPAVRKILEKALHVLFSTDNRTKVQDYVTMQFEKIFKGRVSMQDYIFAREFRGREGYKPGACVPALEIAKRLVEHDPRAEPLVSERVPYVVIYGNSTLPLIRLVRTPSEFLANPTMRLNAHYYIEKVIIPALNRCFTLAGMDANKWYLRLPRKYLRNVFDNQKPKGQGTLDHYVLHQNCFKCDGRVERTDRGVCNNCMDDGTATLVYLHEIVRKSKTKLSQCVEICKNCSGADHWCTSVDCPILHKLTRYDRDQAYIKTVEKELDNLDW